MSSESCPCWHTLTGLKKNVSKICQNEYLYAVKIRFTQKFKSEKSKICRLIKKCYWINDIFVCRAKHVLVDFCIILNASGSELWIIIL